MQVLARGITYTDLHFQGHPRVIATGILEGADGVGLIDPGPASCLTTLRGSLADQGISLGDLRWILLTHIHLDHAGATGSLVRENKGIEVLVHERGAGHMADPSKLLDSARRLFGDLDRLYGEFVPVPAGNLRRLTGGERIRVAEHEFEVAYTPGHASHHVSYYHRDSRIAFVGDVAGIRTGPALYVLPPTPPPDIDLEAWSESVDLVERWLPETLFITHFGPHSGVSAHLQTLRENLRMMSELARRTLEGDGSDEDRISQFEQEMRVSQRQRLPETEAVLYRQTAPLSLNWLGLARYWRKRGVRVPG